MQRCHGLIGGLVGVLMVGLIGCEDTQKKISTLESDNQTLKADVERLRSELTAAQGARDQCLQDKLALQEDNDAMRGQVAQKPANKPLPPADHKSAKQGTAPANWKAVDGGAVLSIEGDLFAPGKTDLQNEAKTSLNKIVSEIRSNFGDRDIYVIGHTDASPIKRSKFKDNRELSAERAAAVARYLESQGIDAKHLAACGWGEHKPVAPNDTKAGMNKNRRVEIFAADPGFMR